MDLNQIELQNCMHTQWISIGLGCEEYHFQFFFVILSNTIFLLCSFAYIFDKVLELFVLLTASWLLILPWFLQELIWFLSWLKRKTHESELTHNSTLSCIRVRTFMKLFFFIYTKMTFLIVNPSERWFIKLTLHFLLTTQLTSPINNQFN